MLIYLMGIQIYDQVSIHRSWSTTKLHRAVLLGFCLKETKITLNIMKFGMHYYVPSGNLNLRSNFNSEKLAKSETLSCLLARVGIKGGQNKLEHCECWRACLFI